MVLRTALSYLEVSKHILYDVQAAPKFPGIATPQGCAWEPRCLCHRFHYLLKRKGPDVTTQRLRLLRYRKISVSISMMQNVSPFPQHVQVEPETAPSRKRSFVIYPPQAPYNLMLYNT